MKTISDRNKIYEYCEHFPIIDYFSFDIRPFLSVVEFESNEDILREGDTPNHLYYLVDGRAKLYLSHSNGKISLINFLNAPCFVGEMELLGAQEGANGVKAITNCVCLAIHIHECKDQVLNDTKFLRYLCRFLSQKAIGNTYNYSQNQSYPLEVRLAKFILSTSYKGIYREQHTEVSEFLGVSYRHLLYVIASFVKRGYMKKSEHGYYLQDTDALGVIAEKY